MSVAGTERNSFAAYGVPQAISGVNLYENSATQKFPLGFKLEDAQGNVYRYAKFGAATNRGVVVSHDLSEDSVDDTDNVIIAPASAVNVGDGGIGSYYVEITLASVTLNQYAGGKFITTDDTGEGYTYRIVGNTATGTPASGNFRLQLADPIQVALDTTTDFMIIGSRYGNLEGATSNTDYDIVGVTMATMTQDYFGWVITKGPVGILSQGTTTSGNAIILSTTAGAVTDALTTGVIPRWGRCIFAGDSTGAAGCVINCEAC